MQEEDLQEIKLALAEMIKVLVNINKGINSLTSCITDNPHYGNSLKVSRRN